MILLVITFIVSMALVLSMDWLLHNNYIINMDISWIKNVLPENIYRITCLDEYSKGVYEYLHAKFYGSHEWVKGTYLYEYIKGTYLYECIHTKICFIYEDFFKTNTLPGSPLKEFYVLHRNRDSNGDEFLPISIASLNSNRTGYEHLNNHELIDRMYDIAHRLTVEIVERIEIHNHKSSTAVDKMFSNDTSEEEKDFYRNLRQTNLQERDTLINDRNDADWEYNQAAEEVARREGWGEFSERDREIRATRSAIKQDAIQQSESTREQRLAECTRQMESAWAAEKARLAENTDSNIPTQQDTEN